LHNFVAFVLIVLSANNSYSKENIIMKDIKISKDLSLMSECELLARTIYGEAGCEYNDNGIDSLVAVGLVVRNRVRAQTWYGKDIQEVCLKPLQFSCWNKNNPNLKDIKKVDKSNKIYDMCLRVAKGILNNAFTDITCGANHYYSTIISEPKWTKDVKPVYTIGKHRFYKL
jgi:spore germination cell wall hydrolase CwlJ-like protein